jgi:hypothetical protein
MISGRSADNLKPLHIFSVFGPTDVAVLAGYPVVTALAGASAARARRRKDDALG